MVRRSSNRFYIIGVLLMLALSSCTEKPIEKDEADVCMAFMERFMQFYCAEDIDKDTERCSYNDIVIERVSSYGSKDEPISTYIVYQGQLKLITLEIMEKDGYCYPVSENEASTLAKYYISQGKFGPYPG